MTKLYLGCLVWLFIVAGGYSLADEKPTAPPAASIAGYTVHTFSSASFQSDNVDTKTSYESGFQWYLSNLYHKNTSPSAITLNDGGSLTTAGALASIGATEVPPFFVGTAFGCGAYMSAEISFDPATLGRPGGYPSFWAIDLSNAINRSEHWAGAGAGYMHFAELDIAEFDWPWASYPLSYGATMHDTYGVYGVTCAGWCHVSKSSVVKAPDKTDFNLYHRVAALWVPATNSSNGYVKFFFDDIQEGDGFSWTQYTNQPPPPTSSTAWTLGVLDRDHLVLVLASGPNTRMRVKSVDVWQGPGACNVKR